MTRRGPDTLEIDAWVASLAHDLRDPVAAITATLELLRHRHDSPEKDADLGRIQRAINRMNCLIDDLLDAKRLDLGSLSLEVGPCDTGSLLRETCELFRPLADGKSIVVDERVTPGLPLVFADRGRMMRVFSNLLANAIKFTPVRGRIALRAFPTKQSIRFIVEDSGPGIPKDDHARIFDRYWRSSDSGRAGMGLGLYIAKEIVDAHGGSIQLETDLGLGCRFVVDLPMALDSRSAGLDLHGRLDVQVSHAPKWLRGSMAACGDSFGAGEPRSYSSKAKTERLTGAKHSRSAQPAGRTVRARKKRG